jgi:hypothetical protein
MRKSDPASAPPAPGSEDSAPVQLICLALLLSVLVLGCRIASIW